MTSALRDRVDSFRNQAVAQGFPVGDVARWAAVARPCVRLAQDGDGPVAGRFGGPLLLPADVLDPARPFVATVDFAALPVDATGLPLPPDGHLLLFAFPEDDSDYADVGSAVYVPAGTAVSERDKHFSWWSSVDEYREVIAVVHGAMRAAEAGRVDGVVSKDVSDWVLLADWHTDIDGWEGATVHWRRSAWTWPRGASTASSPRGTGIPEPILRVRRGIPPIFRRAPAGYGPLTSVT
jgi:hypothetical protein